jgi:hypothetical protein
MVVSDRTAGTTEARQSELGGGRMAYLGWAGETVILAADKHGQSSDEPN